MDEFLADLGDEALTRPNPTLRGSIVAAAAVLAVVGLFAIAVDTDDGSGGTNTVAIVLGLIAVAVGHALLVSLPGHVRPAGVAFIALGTVFALGFIFDDIDSPSLLLFLLTAAYTVQWVLGPARGASVLLTLGLLSAWGFVLDLVAGDDSGSASAVPFGDITVPDTSFTNGDDTVSYVSLLIGIALLAATRGLDSRGFHGIATSTVIVGDFAFVIGVFGVVSTFDDDAAGSIFVILAGLVLAFVGSAGDRRFTSWLGGIGLLIGLVALLTTAVDVDDAVQFGLAAIIVGAGIILAIAFAANAGGPDARSTTEGMTAAGVTTADAADVDPAGDVDPGGGATAGNVGPGSEAADIGAAVDAAAPAEAPTAADELPATPPVAAAPEQGWHIDPSGRHQLRWHDGTAWTAHVSDEGQTSTDEGL